MAIDTISCRNFRNLTDETVPFCEKGVTALLGSNGQGKTNLLEAVYFLATTKSFRGATHSEMTTHGCDGFDVAGTARSNDRRTRLQVSSSSQGIQRIRNDKRSTPGEYLSVLKMLALSSAQMPIINGGPEERRRFLDRGIMGISRTYLKSLSRYNRIRRHRNAVLQGLQRGRLDKRHVGALEAWSEQFVEAGVNIISQRAAFSEGLKKKPWRFNASSTGKRERLT